MRLSIEQEQALRRLLATVEAHLSAYAPDDEKSESDQDMADALARFFGVRKYV